MTRKLPASASIAEAIDDVKLFAPSAARNTAPLVTVVRDNAPKRGAALEIASGTGQHIIAYAAATPQLHWHPTELDALRRASIDAYVVESGLGNIAPAEHLDATAQGWADHGAPKELIVLSNLLHLISVPEARTILEQVSRSLTPGGVFILYGPFRRNGQLISEADREFDGQLRQADPAIGYKETQEIAEWLTKANLMVDKIVEMPANNLAFISRKENV